MYLFLDFAKAFNRVSHVKLLYKLFSLCLVVPSIGRSIITYLAGTIMLWKKKPSQVLFRDSVAAGTGPSANNWTMFSNRTKTHIFQNKHHEMQHVKSAYGLTNDKSNKTS